MASATLPELGLRPLSARSVVLSLLLGMHPAEAPVRDLVGRVSELGVSESTLRVALTRMVAAGDLDRRDATYRLSERLLARQRRQDDALSPATVESCGDWHFVVITSQGREAARRQQLRRTLASLRLAELREGVWLRPANLAIDWPAPVTEEAMLFLARPEGDPVALARSLWNLDEWRTRADQLIGHLADTREPGPRIAAAAAIIRHLLTDPVLPADLLPADWPGDEMRDAYAAYQAELRQFLMPG